MLTMEKPLLTIREVAQMLHVHVNTVRRWSNQGIITSYRLGVRGVRRFKREEVEELVTRLKKNEGEQ